MKMIKTVYPKEPINNFNDWILYIKQQVTQSKKVKK